MYHDKPDPLRISKAHQEDRACDAHAQAVRADQEKCARLVRLLNSLASRRAKVMVWKEPSGHIRIQWMHY